MPPASFRVGGLTEGFAGQLANELNLHSNYGQRPHGSSTDKMPSSFASLGHLWSAG